MNTLGDNHTTIISEIQAEYTTAQTDITNLRQEITTHTNNARQQLANLLTGAVSISANITNAGAIDPTSVSGGISAALATGLSNFHEAGEAVRSGVISSVTKIENSLETATSTIQDKIALIGTTVSSDALTILTDLKSKLADIESKIVEVRTNFINHVVAARDKFETDVSNIVTNARTDLEDAESRVRDAGNRALARSETIIEDTRTRAEDIVKGAINDAKEVIDGVSENAKKAIITVVLVGLGCAAVTLFVIYASKQNTKIEEDKKTPS